MFMELCVMLVMKSQTTKQTITNCTRCKRLLRILLVFWRSKKYSRALLGILFVCAFYTLVRLELWVARTKVGYLNDPCELGEDKLDQFRTGKSDTNSTCFNLNDKALWKNELIDLYFNIFLKFINTSASCILPFVTIALLCIPVVTTYAKLLEETNQTYWLDFGTLLGAHRCNDVLPHDGKISWEKIFHHHFHITFCAKFEMVVSFLDFYSKYLNHPDIVAKWSLTEC